MRCVADRDLAVDEPAADRVQVDASEKTRAVERSNGVNRLDLTTLQVDNQVV